MELAAASEMSLGYRVDKQPTWHPIWRARYRVAVDAVRRFRSRGLPIACCRASFETFCGAGLRPGPAIHTRRRELPWPIYVRRALALPSLDYYRFCTARAIRAAAQDIGRRASDVHVLAVGTCAIN